MSGTLIDGVWTEESKIPVSADGNFHRKASTFRHRISEESGAQFAPEAGRYHLHVAYACPWAHRMLITRALKGLEEVISVSVVHPLMLDNGWEFTGGPEFRDQVNERRFMHEVYTAAAPDYTGRVTVPVLWDKKLNTIVNNESAEIIRMFNADFGTLATNDVDLAPSHLLPQIDAVNEIVYYEINNGVYKCGFTSAQSADDEAVSKLFNALDQMEDRLAETGFLVGGTLTEADIRLFVTLIRFDLVYILLFKCNLRRVSEYPNLTKLLRHIYSLNGVADTVDFAQIKNHYFGSLRSINPQGIVPAGPMVEFLG